MEYREILNRAEDSAKYLVDESCDFSEALKENTYESWQEYLVALESFDVSDAAHSEADSWDVVIYTHKALQLIECTWGSDLDRAEESMNDCGFEFESFSQCCTSLAYWIVYHAVYEALEEYIAEMQELAAAQQENASE